MLNAKDGFFYSFVVFLILASVSTGFDIYSHSVSYYYYDQIINSTDVFFEVLVVPRYMLLSYMYEVFSRLGVPLGWVSLVLVLVPVLCVVSNIKSRLCIGGQYNIVDASLLLSMLGLVLFYSGMSLVLLWFLAYLVTRRDFLLLGGFLHPFGMVVFLLGLVFVSGKGLLRYCLMLVFVVLFMYLSTFYDFFTSSLYEAPRYRLDSFGDFYGLFAFAVEAKYKEILVLLLVVSFFLLLKKRLVLFFEKGEVFWDVSVGEMFFKYFVSFAVVVFAFYMSSKPSLMTSTLGSDANPVIYAAWLDWGGKDLDYEYGELYRLRYW